jgi:Type ISP C-terminal specificity domain
MGKLTALHIRNLREPGRYSDGDGLTLVVKGPQKPIGYCEPRYQAGGEANHSGVGKVFINAEQHFANVPLAAWEFYIGGYQPAQKWLKDRKGRELSYEDILHYRKIIKILSETDRIMQSIVMELGD